MFTLGILLKRRLLAPKGPLALCFVSALRWLLRHRQIKLSWANSKAVTIWGKGTISNDESIVLRHLGVTCPATNNYWTLWNPKHRGWSWYPWPVSKQVKAFEKWFTPPQICHLNLWHSYLLAVNSIKESHMSMKKHDEVEQRDLLEKPAVMAQIPCWPLSRKPSSTRWQLMPWWGSVV